MDNRTKIYDLQMATMAAVAAMMTFLLIGTAVGKYSGGTGEPNDPYRIATAEDLNDIGNHEDDWDKHFVLVNDVNLAQYTGTQFKIIGRYIAINDPNNKPFTGVFDGNNYKILNFTWNSTNRDCVGLFGYVSSSGQIRNLKMVNVNINAPTQGYFGCVGGLVGYNYKGTITNSFSTGTVLGTMQVVGGLVGENAMGEITNCFSAAGVTGYNWVGGLVGYNYKGTITNSYSTGSIKGVYTIGGLVGVNDEGEISKCYSRGTVSGTRTWTGGLVGANWGTIADCYSAGTVSGYMYVGGLAGWNIEGTVTKCYSIAFVSGTKYAGGLVGYNEYATITASFWDIETSGQSISAGGTPKTTVEMKTMSTFTNAGWDFVEIWGIGENQTYPYLRFAPAGDFNYDKKVDLLDLAILASHWLEER